MSHYLTTIEYTNVDWTIRRMGVEWAVFDRAQMKPSKAEMGSLAYRLYLEWAKGVPKLMGSPVTLNDGLYPNMVAIYSKDESRKNISLFEAFTPPDIYTP